MTAKEIKQLRLRLSLTQEQFAIKLHITYATVSRWERNITKPSRLANEKLIKLLTLSRHISFMR